MDHLDGTRQIVAVEHLGMDGERICASLREPGDLIKRVGDHEMNVERKLGRLGELLDQRHAHGQIGDEMAVHDVDVHEPRARLLDAGDVVAHRHEIRGQDRRGDPHLLEHAHPPIVAYRSSAPF